MSEDLASDVVANEMRDVAPSACQRSANPLLRHGITPYLVFSDVFSFLLAVSAVKLNSVTLWTLLPVILLFYTAGGLFRSRLTLSALDDLPSLVGSALAAAAAVTWLGALASHLYISEMLRCAAFFAVTVVVDRAVLYRLVYHARSKLLVSHSTLILGAGRIGGQLADFLAEHREYGLRPVGFLDEHPLLRPSDCDVPVIGKPADLAAAIRENGIQDVIVAFSNIRESAMVDVIRTCDRLDCEIFGSVTLR
jgi:FlaA1/EpsC-like NDP-sugar epimerase